jgi:protein O-GlcNAc transferase
MIFQTILTHKVAESKAANQQAAEAARHLGALARLRDTNKALNAYRQAVSLDPESADGWNELGHLLLRIGQLKNATEAFLKVHIIGEKANDHVSIACAYSNLGTVYSIRGDSNQAEAMHRKALELSEALGLKEISAMEYGNLGTVYRDREDLNQAEAMYRKALELSEALGRKEGSAIAYNNLGVVYETQGDVIQAEAMYQKALTLFQEIGAAPQVEHVQKTLRALHGASLSSPPP